jgi:hypothetical protein
MQQRFRTLVSSLRLPLLSVFALIGVLAGCSSNTSTNAALSTACPTRTTTTFHTVTGTIATLTATSATLTTTQGSVTVQFTSTTRFTVLTTLARAKLVTGTVVQVMVGQASSTGVGTDAQSILVQTGQTSSSPFGGGGRGSTGRGSTGRGSFNPACRATGTVTTAAFRGVRGTITSINLALNQCTVTDQQGGSYVFTLTSATVVAQQTTGTAKSLHVGDTLSVSGQQSSAGVQATTIQDQTAH